MASQLVRPTARVCRLILHAGMCRHLIELFLDGINSHIRGDNSDTTYKTCGAIVMQVTGATSLFATDTITHHGTCCSNATGHKLMLASAKVVFQLCGMVLLIEHHQRLAVVYSPRTYEGFDALHRHVVPSMLQQTVLLQQSLQSGSELGVCREHSI
jgi:hypothetical protein